MTTPRTGKPFAEIIESSLISWRGHCWEWDSIPSHGSIITIDTADRKLYGLVHAVSTGSQDTGRTAFAYKKNEEDLKKDHPHIFEFLATTFTCLPLGYAQGSELRYQLAPIPPKIHAFITMPDPTELQHFFSHEKYLHTLFMHADQLLSLDDLLLALLEKLSHAQVLTHDRLKRFIQTYSLLTANDYRRLKLFLMRVQPMLERSTTPLTQQP